MLTQKIKQRAYLLKKVRNIVGKKETHTLYKSSTLPYLDQGHLFYNASTKDLLKSMHILKQLSWICTVYGKSNWPGTHQAHIECKLMNLKNRRISHLLKRAHRKSFITETLKNTKFDPYDREADFYLLSPEFILINMKTHS